MESTNTTNVSTGGKKFKVNVCNARHELPLLKELIATHNWEVNHILIYKTYLTMILLGSIFKR